MDIYASDYWKITVFLQKCIGFWVFQKSPWKNYIAWIYVYSFIFSFMISMGLRLYIELGVNLEIVIENTLGEMYLFVVFFKLTTSILYEKKFKEIYELIANDWKIIIGVEELRVMHKYTKIGRKVVLLYSGYMIIGVSTFLSLPVFSPLLDYIIPLENATRPKALPYYAEYGIDIEKYYYPMITQAIFGGIGTVMVLVTYDLGFIQIVQHVVALFKVVNVCLARAAEVANTMGIIDSKNFAEKENIAHRHIVRAIELHQKALSYVDLVEDCYSLSWLIILFINMVMIGGGISTLLLKLHRPEEAFRYGVVVCAGFIHFYYIFFPGQKIVDTSTSIFDQCYACTWYNLSRKSKVLIQIMLLRSLRQSELTGGKMFVLSMETYCNMMKTGFSGLTVLNSQR